MVIIKVKNNRGRLLHYNTSNNDIHKNISKILGNERNEEIITHNSKIYNSIILRKTFYSRE